MIRGNDAVEGHHDEHREQKYAHRAKRGAGHAIEQSGIGADNLIDEFANETAEHKSDGNEDRE